MTIPLIGPTGFFTRIGAIGGIIADVNFFQANNLVADTDFITQYFSGQDLALIPNVSSQQNSAQTTMGGYLSYWQTQAAAIINQMVLNDNPLLTSTNTVGSLQELIYQMQQNSQSLKRYLPSINVTPSLIQGNGVIVTSTVTPDGLNCEMMLDENITVQCTQDQNLDPSLAGNENFQASGQVGYSTLSWLYPAGSGATVGTSAINASLDNSGGTLLVNGDFENWTANVPNNWEVETGTPGTTIQEGNNPYTGSHNLVFVGNGAENTAITQTFGVDTAATISYPGQWAVNCWIAVPSAPGAGVLRIALVDGSNTVINDEQGNPNTVSQDLTVAGTSYAPLSAVFRLPQLVPSTIKLQIALTTALSNTKTVRIDRLAFGPVTTLYQMGPSFAIFSGSVDFYAGINPSTPGDFWTLQTQNLLRPQNSWLWLLDRLYGLKQNNLVFPTSNLPTISELLIADSQASLNTNPSQAQKSLGVIPFGIAEGPDDNLWIASGSSGVTQYIPTTGAVNTFALAGTFVDICAGPDGNMWATDETGFIWKVTLGGSGTSYALAGSIPAGICVGSDNNLWVADKNGAVWKVTTAGTPTKYVLAGSVHPTDICNGPDSNLWVADITKVWQVTTGGVGTSTSLIGSSEASWICSAHGFLWLSDIALSFIYRVDTTFGVTYIDVDAFGMSGIVSGPDGNIWATTANGLIKITPSPLGAKLYDVDGPRANSLFLYDICVGPDMNFWITDQLGFVWNIS